MYRVREYLLAPMRRGSVVTHGAWFPTRDAALRAARALARRTYAYKLQVMGLDGQVFQISVPDGAARALQVRKEPKKRQVTPTKKSDGGGGDR